MKIKFNWGFGILLSIILFMTASVIAVVIMMNKDVDLVSSNYYEKEVKYQQQIDTEKRTKELNENIKINILNKTLVVSFPDTAGVTGELYFYRPSDYKKDFSVPISLDTNREQAVNVSNLLKGYWRLQVKWIMNKNEYYSEQPVYIN